MEQEHYVFPQEEDEDPARERPWNDLDAFLKFLVMMEVYIISVAARDFFKPDYSCAWSVIVLNLMLMIWTIHHLRKRKAEKKQQPK